MICKAEAEITDDKALETQSWATRGGNQKPRAEGLAIWLARALEGQVE